MVRRRRLATLMVSLLMVVMVAAPAAADESHEFDMNDRFATEKGASGSGEVEVDDGSVEIKVEAEGLEPNHKYELHVTIDFDPDSVIFGPVTSDDDGEIEFEEDLDLVALVGPGTYRLDFFVTHIHDTVAGTVGVGEFITGLLDRDPLLSCEPAAMVTISDDNGDDGDDDD